MHEDGDLRMSRYLNLKRSLPRSLRRTFEATRRNAFHSTQSPVDSLLRQGGVRGPDFLDAK